MFKNPFRRNRPDIIPPSDPKPTPYRHVRSSDLGIPPAIYRIVYEMDLFDSSSSPMMFSSTSCELALYESNGVAAAAPVDRRRDEEFKTWYLRRIREATFFDKPLAKLTAKDVHDAFYPDEQLKLKGDYRNLFERRPALFYESSLENVLADTYRRKRDKFKTIQ